LLDFGSANLGKIFPNLLAERRQEEEVERGKALHTQNTHSKIVNAFVDNR